MAPIRLINEVVMTANVHSYPTRAAQHGDVQVPKPNVELYRQSFKYRAAVLIPILIFFTPSLLWFYIFYIWVWTVLTHWGRVTHICVGKPIIIGSDNGLSPDRRQAIIWTNAGLLLIGPLGTNFSENLSEIHAFSFKKMHLKMSSAKWRPFCLGLNVLMLYFNVK